LQAIPESDPIFRAIFYNIPHPAWIYANSSLRFLAVNDEAIEQYRYSREDFLALTIADIRPAEDRPKLAEALARSDGTPKRAGIFRHLKQDGTVLHAHVTSQPILFESQEAMLVIAIDVTKSVTAERELDSSIKRLEHSLEASLHALTTVGEIRDPYTAGHQRRVADLATAIAGELRLGSSAQACVGIAGLVHDVGKVGIPIDLLAKPMPLSQLERDLVRTHAQLGHDILKHIPFAQPVHEIVLQHHERLDGSGYPRGLRNGEILLESKIIAVADVMESMTSHRAYRAALGRQTGLDEIVDGAGRLYDADVVEACQRLFSVHGYSFPQIGDLIHH
jgi:PAS domain S-box-containing protein